jgi:hypothetical protein
MNLVEFNWLLLCCRMQSTGAKPKLDPMVHMKIKTAATFAQAVVRARVE